MNKRIKELEKKMLNLKKEIEALKSKPKFTKGGWYISTEKEAFMCVTEINGLWSRGLNYVGEWSDSCSINPSNLGWKEATPIQVKEMLTKEGIKRGFKKGVTIQTSIRKKEFKLTSDIGYYEEHFDSGKKNVIYAKCENTEKEGVCKEGVCLFDSENGWCKVIDTHLEINGKTVEIDEDSVKIGCKRMFIKDFKLFTEMLESLDITNFNNTDVGTVTTKQFKEIYDKL